jgi:molybdopterin converting factor subunit 1
MNDVNVLFFATLKDKAGVQRVQKQVPAGAVLGDLKTMLIKDYPGLADSSGYIMAAINHEYAADDEPIPQHAEIAFFPPVSGG